MSEEIVACPGCAKKFRIPEGAPPGSFACTACNADVPYGAVAKGAARPAGKSAGVPMARPAPATRPAPAAAARPVQAAAAPAASSRRAPSSRRADRHEADEPPKKSNQGLIWGGIVIGGAVILGLAYQMNKPAPPAPKPPETATAPKPKPPEKVEPAKPAGTDPVPAQPKPEPAKPAEPVKPAVPSAGGPDPKIPIPEKLKPEAAIGSAERANYAMLGQVVKSVAGTTDEERSDMDRMVATAMDFTSGKDGSNAEGKLIRLGKKAVPSILSGFSKQYTTTKWSTDMEQWGADKLQDLLHRISGADGPRSEFWPKFMGPGVVAPPEDFEKAAKMWIDWWNLAGSTKDKYKPRND